MFAVICQNKWCENRAAVGHKYCSPECALCGRYGLWKEEERTPVFIQDSREYRRSRVPKHVAVKIKYDNKPRRKESFESFDYIEWEKAGYHDWNSKD